MSTGRTGVVCWYWYYFTFISPSDHARDSRVVFGKRASHWAKPYSHVDRTETSQQMNLHSFRMNFVPIFFTLARVSKDRVLRTLKVKSHTNC